MKKLEPIHLLKVITKQKSHQIQEKGKENPFRCTIKQSKLEKKKKKERKKDG